MGLRMCSDFNIRPSVPDIEFDDEEFDDIPNIQFSKSEPLPKLYPKRNVGLPITLADYRGVSMKTEPNLFHPEHPAVEVEEEDRPDNLNVRIGQYKSTPNIFSGSLENLRITGEKRPQSLKKRMRERHKLSVDLTNGESRANLYCDMVERDTLSCLTNTLRMSKFTLDKSGDIMDELDRQGEVIRSAEGDLNVTEQEIDESQEIITGMKSFRGKLANVLKRKKRKIQLYNESKFENLDNGIKIRRNSLPNVVNYKKLDNCSKYRNSANQTKIQQGLRDLNLVVDTIKERQVYCTEEIKRQDKQLDKFSRSMDRTDLKLKKESDRIRSIM